MSLPRRKFVVTRFPRHSWRGSHVVAMIDHSDLLKIRLKEVWGVQIVDAVLQDKNSRFSVYRRHLLHYICVVYHVTHLQHWDFSSEKFEWYALIIQPLRAIPEWCPDLQSRVQIMGNICLFKSEGASCFKTLLLVVCASIISSAKKE